MDRSRFLAAVVAILGWFAIVAQLVLMLNHATLSVPETLFRFFGYFTILTNTLVAWSFTSLWLNSHYKAFFARPSVFTAITVYIIVVGIVYNTVLRFTWNPEGLQRVVDELLHSIVPLLTTIYWWTFVRGKNVRLTSIPKWLWYPLAYCLYILVQGAFSGFYPYPFIDVSKLGYPIVAKNCFFVCIAFVVVALILVAIDRSSKARI